jgi:dTMP kinase
MTEKGMFITFEGGEGAGKSTLIDKVYGALLASHFNVLKTRAPGGSKLGESIRNILLHKQDIGISARCELLLFLADRAQHVDEVIAPALATSQIVLCDRYNDSTIAYQGAARGFGEETVQKLCGFASGFLQPDLTIYLDLDPQIGLERVQKTGISKDRIESENLAFHQKIREAFLKIAAKEKQRFHVIDATLAPNDVFQLVMTLIRSKLNSLE